MLGIQNIINGGGSGCCSQNCSNRNIKRHLTVAVEGNIGSGKSTFLQYFKNSKNVEVVPEPVEMWKNVQNHNILDLMYKDPTRWSLTFQSYVQLTMLQCHTQRVSEPVKMMERSIYSAQYCFVQNLHDSGRMPDVDYAILGEWFDYIVEYDRVEVDLIVYLQASPEVCLNRLLARNRKEETTVPLEYLESLHKLHETWLVEGSRCTRPAPVLVLDANRDLSELKPEFERRRTEILCGYT